MSDDDEEFVPWDYPVDANSYVKNLLVDADEEDDVRLHTAALCGDSEGLASIISEEIALQWINFKVRPFVAPPLRLAVTGGNVECVRLLLTAGAERELEDIKGQTPLFVATSQKHLPIMKLLLENGANPEGSLKNRGTPLLIAVRDGFAEGVRLLLKFGANPEPFEQLTSCVAGWPLHHSVVYSHFSVFHSLLQAGAVPNIEDLASGPNTSVIQRLSIPHAILKYSKNRPEFAELYHQCGGNLLQTDQKDLSVLKDANILQGSKAYETVVQLLSKPMSLKCASRLRIRKLLGKNRLRHIESLDLPVILHSYLRLKEFNIYVSKSLVSHNKKDL